MLNQSISSTIARKHTSNKRSPILFPVSFENRPINITVELFSIPIDKMKLVFGLLSTGFGKTFELGESENLPGLCPELPNQENFEIERYLGQWHV